eukprot:SAG31_NODE_16279_length_715_cov_1.646104_1_plen_49_part_10
MVKLKNAGLTREAYHILIYLSCAVAVAASRGGARCRWFRPDLAKSGPET